MAEAAEQASLRAGLGGPLAPLRRPGRSPPLAAQRCSVCSSQCGLLQVQIRARVKAAYCLLEGAPVWEWYGSTSTLLPEVGRSPDGEAGEAKRSWRSDRQQASDRQQQLDEHVLHKDTRTRMTAILELRPASLQASRRCGAAAACCSAAMAGSQAGACAAALAFSHFPLGGWMRRAWHLATGSGLCRLTAASEVRPPAASLPALQPIMRLCSLTHKAPLVGMQVVWTFLSRRFPAIPSPLAWTSAGPLRK